MKFKGTSLNTYDKGYLIYAYLLQVAKTICHLFSIDFMLVYDKVDVDNVLCQ